LKTATELALDDYKSVVKTVQARGGGKVPPVTSYVAYYSEVLNAMANGKFGPEDVKRIEAKQMALMKAFPDRTGIE